MFSLRALLSVAAVATTAGMALLATPALAAQTDPHCIREAAHEYLFCRAACREAYQVAKDECRDIDHDCADACRAGLDACLDGPSGPLTLLEACREECSETLEGAKAACREAHAEGTPERDACIDAAQLVAFGCRDTCREGVAEAVRACRFAFRSCILACPPPAE
jgi:hypothetical protein